MKIILTLILAMLTIAVWSSDHDFRILSYSRTERQQVKSTIPRTLTSLASDTYDVGLEVTYTYRLGIRKRVSHVRVASWEHHSRISRIQWKKQFSSIKHGKRSIQSGWLRPKAVYDYAAFGEAYAPNTSVSVEQRYTYTGRERNAVSGSMYYRYRTYFAGIGRFGGRDPIYYGGGINLYGYVGNDPINKTDPYGRNYSDVWHKTCGGRFKTAYGLAPAIGAAIGAGASLGLCVMFFPDTCEIGIYTTASFEGAPPTVDYKEVYKHIGLEAGGSLSGEVAYYNGTGTPDANSFKGVFHTVGGNLGPVAGSGYKGGGWTGGTLGLSGGAPAGASYKDVEYKMIASFTLPKCLCYLLIAALP